VTGFKLSFSDHVSNPSDYKLRVPHDIHMERSENDPFDRITSKLDAVGSDVVSHVKSGAHKLMDSFTDWVEKKGHLHGSLGLPHVNLTFDQPRHHLLKRL